MDNITLHFLIILCNFNSKNCTFIHHVIISQCCGFLFLCQIRPGLWPINAETCRKLALWLYNFVLNYSADVAMDIKKNYYLFSQQQVIGPYPEADQSTTFHFFLFQPIFNRFQPNHFYGSVIMWYAYLMQQGNFIDIFLVRHVSGT